MLLSGYNESSSRNALCLAGLLLMFPALLGADNSQSSQSVATPLALSLESQRTLAKAMPNTESLQPMRMAAVLKAQATAVLASQIDGLVNGVGFREGQSFEAGDILVSLDCTMPEAALGKAMAQRNFAANNYASMRKLASLNSASDMEVAKAQAEFSSADADLQSARYRVKQCFVLAPYDGHVVQLLVQPYETVQAKTAMLEIVNNADLITEFIAPSSQLASFDQGARFTLLVSETGAEYEGRVDRVVPRVDAVNQTVKVIGTLNRAAPELWSGMSGWALIN